MMRMSKLVVAGVILGVVVLAGWGGDLGAGTVTRLGTPPVGADPVGSATVEMAAGETALEVAFACRSGRLRRSWGRWTPGWWSSW